jgi:hypothetical protein
VARWELSGDSNHPTGSDSNSTSRPCLRGVNREGRGIQAGNCVLLRTHSESRSGSPSRDIRGIAVRQRPRCNGGTDCAAAYSHPENILSYPSQRHQIGGIWCCTRATSGGSRHHAYASCCGYGDNATAPPLRDAKHLPSTLSAGAYGEYHRSGFRPVANLCRDINPAGTTGTSLPTSRAYCGGAKSRERSQHEIAGVEMSRIGQIP